MNSTRLFAWCSSSSQGTPSVQPLTNCVSPYPLNVIRLGEIPFPMSQLPIDCAWISVWFILYSSPPRLSECTLMSKNTDGWASKKATILASYTDASYRMFVRP